MICIKKTISSNIFVSEHIQLLALENHITSVVKTEKDIVIENYLQKLCYSDL